MYVSVNGIAREVKEIYAGGSDGIAHKITGVYGSVNGTAKLLYSGAQKEPNAFDVFSWAEIKQLADEGRLLDYFHRFDKVTIRLQNPLVGTNSIIDSTEYYQNELDLVISQISATGMQLVSSIATPYCYYFSFPEAFKDLIKNATSQYSKKSLGQEYWGLSSEYTYAKLVNEALPEDLHAVLTDFHPLTKYEYGYDAENKYRLLTEYSDCRVRQCSTCGYSYHREFVPEHNREEYILDTTYFERNKNKYKKFLPPERRAETSWDKCYSYKGAEYQRYGDIWRYTFTWNDPNISWTWDWENWNNANKLDKINTPTYKTGNTISCAFIPEIQIGTL